MPATTPDTVSQFGIRRERQSQTPATPVRASVTIQTVVRASIRLFPLVSSCLPCSRYVLGKDNRYSLFSPVNNRRKTKTSGGCYQVVSSMVINQPIRWQRSIAYWRLD